MLHASGPPLLSTSHHLREVETAAAKAEAAARRRGGGGRGEDGDNSELLRGIGVNFDRIKLAKQQAEDAMKVGWRER